MVIIFWRFPVKKLRNISWVIFLLSIVILSTFLRSTTGVAAPSHHSRIEPTVIVTLITSAVSLISGIITSISALRQDRVNTRKIELELEKTKLEIAKLRRETETDFAKK
jgi:hypothetical protein